jgi:hypothetical protein
MTFTAILLAAVALSADTGSVAGTATVSEPAPPRGYHEINDDIREVMRIESRYRTMEERAKAVRKMCELYEELSDDPRLETSGTLTSYKTKLWSRLTRIKENLQRQLAREAKNSVGDATEAELAALGEVTSSMAAQMDYMNYTMGGPSYVFSQSSGAFGGGMTSDYGQDLIDLIQRTIKPDHWDVAGGPGSMFYYRPLMALVVRATSEIHGNVGGLLGAMRRAGN